MDLNNDVNKDKIEKNEETNIKVVKVKKKRGRKPKKKTEEPVVKVKKKKR